MTASTRPPPSPGDACKREHVRRKKVSQQALQARFTKLPAQVRQLEQVVQVVDGVSERAHFAQLFFRGLQVLLHFFKLRESFFDVLIELLLHLIGDGHELLVHAIADRVETLRGLLIQALELDFKLLRGEQQRARQFAARLGQAARLFFPAASAVAAQAQRESLKSPAGCGL